MSSPWQTNMHSIDSNDNKRIRLRIGARSLSPFLCGLLFLLCLSSLVASDLSPGDGQRNSTGTRDKSLTGKPTQSDEIKEYTQPFYLELARPLPVLPDLPNVKRSRIETRASNKFTDYYDKGSSLFKQIISKLQDYRSRDTGPSSVRKDWTVTDIYPGNPALQDPSFPAEETTCDDSDDEDEKDDDDEDEDDSDDGVDIFATFALEYYRIGWDQNTFKDVIAYLKSNSRIRYRNFYGPAVGVLIAKSIHGQYGAQRAPDRWSDVVWPLWKRSCQQKNINPSSIRLIIQEAIANDDTNELLEELTQGTPKESQNKPRVFAWTKDQHGYYALLRSPNGLGAAYMSLNYPDSMGRKYVSKITAYKDYDIWTMTLELSPIK